MVEAHDDIGVHLDEAAIAVPREPRVARCVRKSRNRRIVEPEVEDGVHHPRHRHARARADRDQERVCGIAEALAGDALDMRDARRHLFRSEEHTSELQSLMRISYAVFCLKKKNTIITTSYLL